MLTNTQERTRSTHTELLTHRKHNTMKEASVLCCPLIGIVTVSAADIHFPVSSENHKSKKWVHGTSATGIQGAYIVLYTAHAQKHRTQNTRSHIYLFHLPPPSGRWCLLEGKRTKPLRVFFVAMTAPLPVQTSRMSRWYQQRHYYKHLILQPKGVPPMHLIQVPTDHQH